jgi:hypothetical protein
VLGLFAPVGRRFWSRWRQARALHEDEGPGEMVRRALHHVAGLVRVSGEVIWFLKYTDPAKRPSVDRTIEIHTATTPDEHAQLDRYRPLISDVRKAREDAGGERWYAYIDDSEEIGYTCWTYSRHAVVQESPLVTLPLPDGVVHYEDAYTPAGNRSQHLGRRTTDALCRELMSRGVHSMVTKIDVENEMTIKGAYAGAWKPIARVHATRWFGRRTRWSVTQIEPDYPELSLLGSISDKNDA